jgi:NitT/TauT family transport system permease protein
MSSADLTNPPVESLTFATEAKPYQPKRKSLGQRAKNIDKVVVLGWIAVFLASIGLWALAVQQGWINKLYAATPRETWNRLIELLGSGKFWSNARVTLEETVFGWALGSSLGLLAGLALGRFRRLARVFDPYFTFANATPKIALAPFFILWFGIDQASKIVLAATIVFFIVQVPVQAAVSTVQPDLDLVATTMGATELQKFRKVVLPGIMAPLFGALRLALVYSLLAVVLGEFIAARAGLGQQLITSSNQFDMATAFAVMIVLACIAVIINSGLGAIERRLLRWQAIAGGKTVVV